MLEHGSHTPTLQPLWKSEFNKHIQPIPGCPWPWCSRSSTPGCDVTSLWAKLSPILCCGGAGCPSPKDRVVLELVLQSRARPHPLSGSSHGLQLMGPS